MILSIYYQRNPSKQFLQTLITEVISNHAYKLFQTILSIYYPKNHPNNSYKLLSQKSFKTIFTNFYPRNHFKQFLQTFNTEVIPNNTFKLFQMILSRYLLSQKSFQAILQPSKLGKIASSKKLLSYMYYLTTVRQQKFKMLKCFLQMIFIDVTH